MDLGSQNQDAVAELDALRATQLSGHRSNPLIASLMSSVVASDHGPPVESIVLPLVSLTTPSNTLLRQGVLFDQLVAALESEVVTPKRTEGKTTITLLRLISESRSQLTNGCIIETLSKLYIIETLPMVVN